MTKKTIARSTTWGTRPDNYPLYVFLKDGHFYKSPEVTRRKTAEYVWKQIGNTVTFFEYVAMDQTGDGAIYAAVRCVRKNTNGIPTFGLYKTTKVIEVFDYESYKHGAH
jgi:hypothetical protein